MPECSACFTTRDSKTTHIPTTTRRPANMCRRRAHRPGNSRRWLLEDAIEDGVHVTKLAIERKRIRQFVAAQQSRNIGIGFDRRAKIPVVLPGFHRVALDESVGLLPKHPG